MAQATVLIPEILSFSPHFLLDDTINIANDGVGRAVDAMEDFLNRWAETRLEREPEWADAADKELERGLVSFQTLLEFHTDIAFDFFEAWSLRNIFAVTPPDLPLVVPHQTGLDLDLDLDLDQRSPEKEAELLAEIDELRRKIENQRYLKRLLKRAARTSRRQGEGAQRRLEKLSALVLPSLERMEMLRALAGETDELYAAVCALPPRPHLANADFVGGAREEPGKRLWEGGKAGYLGWASAQLARQAVQRAPAEGALDGRERDEEMMMAAALREIEREEDE